MRILNHSVKSVGSNSKDFEGSRFGKFTGIGIVGRSICKNHKSSMLWLWRCDCGGEVHSTISNIRRRTFCPQCKPKPVNRRLYTLWAGMISRTSSPKDIGYKSYGGRGISVCEEWRSSARAFEEWAYSNGYQDGLSLDRVDVNGDYTPQNCRWIKLELQQRNKRTNRLISAFGETKCMAEWTEDPRFVGISIPGFRNRLSKFGSAESAITRPVRRARKITAFGETKTAGEWAKDRRCCVAPGQISLRLRRGYSPEEAIVKKPRKSPTKNEPR